MYFNGKYPIFRKVIIPWYESAAIYIVMIILMSFVLLFGSLGISAAFEKREYHEHIWVPITLVVMSIFIILLNAFRLFKKYFFRIKDD